MALYTIREARKKTGKSQEQMAHTLGITASAWGLKENYKRKLWADELLDLSEMAGVDPKEIILKP